MAQQDHNEGPQLTGFPAVLAKGVLVLPTRQVAVVHASSWLTRRGPVLLAMVFSTPPLLPYAANVDGDHCPHDLATGQFRHPVCEFPVV